MSILFDLITNGENETAKLGAALADRVVGDDALPKYIAFSGDLGVGKTVFIRGFITRLIPGAKISSPTYGIVHEYFAALPVYHFDMYRISDEDDLYSIGYYEYAEKNAILLVEWSENIEFALPERYILVSITKPSLDSPDRREVKAEVIGEAI